MSLPAGPQRFLIDAAAIIAHGQLKLLGTVTQLNLDMLGVRMTEGVDQLFRESQVASALIDLAIDNDPRDCDCRWQSVSLFFERLRIEPCDTACGWNSRRNSPP
jgi:hypothetical protein